MARSDWLQLHASPLGVSQPRPRAVSPAPVTPGCQTDMHMSHMRTRVAWALPAAAPCQTNGMMNACGTGQAAAAEATSRHAMC